MVYHFLPVFWRDIGDFLVRFLNCEIQSGELSVSFKQGIITYIPKGDKNKMYLKSWGPIISLLNVAYKTRSFYHKY